MGIFDKFKNKKSTQAEALKATHRDGVSGLPFPAYKGKEPYMFISYAHVDSRAVYQIISDFHDIGYNVWYDEGIEPGIEWPEEIANALDRCSLFVVFITPASANSLNVRNEINFALSKKLSFIAIYLKETALTPGLQLQMGSKQAILMYNMDNESFRRKYTYSFEAVLKPKAKSTSAISEKPVIAVDPFTSKTEKNNNSILSIPKKDITNDCEWIGSKLIKYLGNEKEIIIPSRATILYSNVFKDNPTIERIIIPSSVSAIDFAAFDNCPNLHLVVIEGGYVKISDGNIPVSSRCDKLTFQCHLNSLTQKELQKVFTGPIIFFLGEDFEIDHGLLRKYHGNEKEAKLPESVQIIGGFAFHNCNDLESVIMSDECGAVLDNAFISCPQLTNITIGKSFSSLSKKAFIGCPYVKFSYYKDRKPEKFDELFPDKSIVTEIE